MEKQVIFRNYQDVEPDDLNNIQSFARQSLDHLVGDAVTGSRGYAGFVTSITAAAKVSVAAGRLYQSGAVYIRENAVEFDFTVSLPLQGKKAVLVLVSGSEVETDVNERNFLTNVTTMDTQGQNVAMTRERAAAVNVTAGQESPDPIDPIFDAAYLAVARIILESTGVTDVQMLSDNALPSIAGIASDLADVKTAQGADRAKIVAIDTNLAAIAAKTSGFVSQEALGRMLVRLADLETKDGIPSTAADSFSDYFLDDSGSDLANASSSCLRQEGVRFPDEAAWSGALTLFNPQNPNAKMVGDVLFPAYDRILRQQIGPRQAELALSAYTYQTNEMVQKTMTRTRIRYGDIYTVCTNSGWWGTLTTRYVPETFEHNGENFQTLDVDWDGPLHGWVRVQQYWYDTYEEPYWAAVTVDHSVNGTQVAETFLNANDMWLDAIGLTFTRLAAAGGLTLAICETDRGMPDLQNVISVTTVDRASLLLNQETIIPLQPVFLKGGQRYALILITAADHYVATTQGTNFPSGTLFYVLDGAYQQGDGTKDLCFSLYAAKFRQSRTVIDLNQLQLAGGIAAIDILADLIVPASCALDYEIQIAGTWLPLGKGDVSVLSSSGALQALLPLRAIFTGTPDAAPALRLNNAACRISRSKLAFTHISAQRHLAAGTTSIHVITRLEDYNPAHNTFATKLLKDAGFGTVVTASSVVTEVMPDGAYQVTAVFNLGAAITDYKIRRDATTDAVGRPWHLAWGKDWVA